MHDEEKAKNIYDRDTKTKRQKKIQSPSLVVSHVTALFPLFSRKCTSLCDSREFFFFVSFCLLSTSSTLYPEQTSIEKLPTSKDQLISSDSLHRDDLEDSLRIFDPDSPCHNDEAVTDEKQIQKREKCKSYWQNQLAHAEIGIVKSQVSKLDVIANHGILPVQFENNIRNKKRRIKLVYTYVHH